MASMELVELVPPAKVARELATQVAGVMTDGSTAEGRARVKDFFALCKGHVMNQDACGFVGAVLSAAGDDLMGFPKRRVVEDIFSVLVSMLNTASRSHNVLPALEQLTSVVLSSTTDKTESRLLILGTCFNVFADPALRHKLFVQLVQYAADTNQVALVKPYFGDAKAWAKAWGLGLSEERALYALFASVLDAANDNTGAQTYRVKYLETFEGASSEELASADVRAAAVKAIVGFVKTPANAPGRKHLVDMAAVQSLRGDAEHGRLFRLLSIFATEKVAAYVAYRAENSDYMNSLGVDHEASLETIRLFSLCSLAASSADGSIDYATIASTLQVEEEEAEEWVLSAVRAKLITARMDQLEGTVHVSGYQRRVFDRDAWVEIQSKLHKWRSSVADLLATLRTRTPHGAGNAGAGSMSVLRH